MAITFLAQKGQNYGKLTTTNFHPRMGSAIRGVAYVALIALSAIAYGGIIKYEKMALTLASSKKEVASMQAVKIKYDAETRYAEKRTAAFLQDEAKAKANIARYHEDQLKDEKLISDILAFIRKGARLFTLTNQLRLTSEMRGEKYLVKKINGKIITAKRVNSMTGFQTFIISDNPGLRLMKEYISSGGKVPIFFRNGAFFTMVNGNVEKLGSSHCVYKRANVLEYPWKNIRFTRKGYFSFFSIKILYDSKKSRELLPILEKVGKKIEDGEPFLFVVKRNAQGLIISFIRMGNCSKFAEVSNL